MAVTSTELAIPIRGITLHGTLTMPPDAIGLVVFAHGSGSSRLSPRNRHVAAMLNDAGIATLLFDLLTSAEEARDQLDASLRFDIGLLAERLTAVTDTIVAEGVSRGLPIGYFGASTGAAAALIAAARRPEAISAVVSRGGRPDLAAEALPRVRAPTLLIVGGADPWVADVNRDAAQQLRAAHRRVAVIPGATHLFEERGALDAVARLAAVWFAEHMTAEAERPAPLAP